MEVTTTAIVETSTSTSAAEFADGGTHARVNKRPRANKFYKPTKSNETNAYELDDIAANFQYDDDEFGKKKKRRVENTMSFNGAAVGPTTKPRPLPTALTTKPPVAPKEATEATKAAASDVTPLQKHSKKESMPGKKSTTEKEAERKTEKSSERIKKATVNGPQSTSKKDKQVKGKKKNKMLTEQLDKMKFDKYVLPLVYFDKR